MPPNISRPSSKDIILLLFISALWGGSFVLIDIAGQSFSPLLLSTLRLLIAAAFFIPFLTIHRHATPSNKPKGRQWITLGLIALFGNALPFTLVGWAEHQVTSLESAIIVGTAPIAVLILSHRMTPDEKIRPLSTLGILIGFCGLAVMIVPQMHFSGHILAWAALLVTAFSYALGTVIVRKLDHLTPMTIIAFSVALAALMSVLMLGITLSWTSIPVDINRPEPIAALVLLAIICTTIAGVMFITLLQRSGALFASQCHYLIPCFAALWGGIFLDEIPRGRDGIALGLVLIGVFLTRMSNKET